MPEYTQDNSRLAIATSLGTDQLLLEALTGTEAISQPFHFQFSLLSENPSVTASDLLGKAVTAVIRNEPGDTSIERYINGLVSRFTYKRQDKRFTYYEMEVVPWLWFLSRAARCRIFQNKSVPDILAAIFGEYPFAKFTNRLTDKYDALDYCVQYRETDFNFVSRLMEQYGISYYFEHADGKHELILMDSNTWKACPDAKQIRFDPDAGADLEAAIGTWELSAGVVPGGYTLRDFNFETPLTDLTAESPGVVEAGQIKVSVYDYPCEYGTKTEGQKLSQLRIEEQEALFEQARGTSDWWTLLPGYKFDLTGHRAATLNQAYLLTEVVHSATTGSLYHSDSRGSGYRYSCQFTCMPAKYVYRPPRVTPKPVVEGPQTAFVVGPAGEEIHTDKYGRVKVQFHWDRDGKRDENSSCWVRVSQPAAGNGWGFISLPRIGQEVIVEFLEGNPNRPLVTGSVYNASNQVPYALPDQKTKSLWKTYSSPGGGGFNEIRLEDKKGSEQIFIHAEKDLEVRIKNDQKEIIQQDQHTIIKRHSYQKTEGAQHLEVTQDHITKIGGDQHLRIGGDLNRQVDGGISTQSTGPVQYKSTGKYAVDSSAEVHIKAGMNVVIEAGVGITLKVGGNYITINPAGVQIQGTMVLINSGGAALSGSGASPGTPQPPTAPVEADNAQAGQAAAQVPLPVPLNEQLTNPAAVALRRAAASGAPFCEICAQSMGAQ